MRPFQDLNRLVTVLSLLFGVASFIATVVSIIISYLAWKYPVSPGKPVPPFTIPTYVYIIAVLAVISGTIAWIFWRRWRLSDISHIAKRELDQVVHRGSVLSDALTNNTNRYEWTEANEAEGHCWFESDGYHVATLDRTYHFYKGISQNLTIRAFVLRVDMKLIAGDEGGVIFRWNQHLPGPDTFYYFYIESDGTFGLDKGEKTEGQENHYTLKRVPNNSAVRRGQEDKTYSPLKLSTILLICL